MQISPGLPGLQSSNSQQPTRTQQSAPSFAGKDTKISTSPDKGKGLATAGHGVSAPATAIPWADKVLSSDFFLSSKGGALFLQSLYEAITSSNRADQPEGSQQPQHKQALLNVFHTMLKAKNAKLPQPESFPLIDSLLSGSPAQQQLATKLESVFAVPAPTAQERERAQARLDRFTTILPCKNPRLIAFDHLAGQNIQALLAGDQPEQIPPKPEGFDPLTEKEQQALADLIETTPGLERNRSLQAQRYRNRTSTSTINGYTPLHVAVEYGYLPIVKALLKMPDVDVNARTGAGNGNNVLSTVLSAAVLSGNAKVVKALLAHPDIDVTTRSGLFNNNALEYATEAGNTEIIELLEKHIAQSNITLPPRPEPQTLWERLLAG
jgi:hypothetical protein